MDVPELLPRLSARLSRDNPPVTDVHRAAVAMIVRQGATSAELLIIRRAERAEDPWSGHMALPGGRFEPIDDDLLATALREVWEEIGWRLQDVAHYVGSLPAVPIRAHGVAAGDYVVPLVFALQEDVPWLFNDEVVDAVWLPLANVIRGEAELQVPYSRDGVTIQLPALRADQYAIWGLTYQMIGLLVQQLEPL
jgi:8-oxo-dGTP pyrophosphatase MutT (NUDIX family)